MKNTIANKTESFKRMRQQELSFIKAQPFYGTPKAKLLYDTLKKQYDILQVGVCGSIVSVVTFKKDADTFLELWNKMFPEYKVKQKTSELTELVTTYTMPSIK